VPSSPARAGARRVLVVEDCQLQRKLAGTYLQFFGLEHEFANDVMDAQVMTDLRLPGGTGSDLVRWMMSREADVPPRAVVVTASSEIEDRLECLAAGAAEVLTKPYRAADLSAMFTRLGIEHDTSRLNASK
jgi:CheY-like chemotaxis protein